MAPRALASRTIAAFLLNEDVFTLLVTDVLTLPKLRQSTADAVNMALLQRLGVFTTTQQRNEFKNIWRDLEVGLDAPNLHCLGMMSLAKITFSKLQILNIF